MGMVLMPSPTTVLKQAENLIYGDRANSYGSWSDNAACLAQRWSRITGTKVHPLQATLMMVELKLMRLEQDPTHRDSVIDAIGYLGLYGDLLDNNKTSVVE